MPVGLDPVGKGGAVFEDVDREGTTILFLGVRQGNLPIYT
jgi:hypothetical protein